MLTPIPDLIGEGITSFATKTTNAVLDKRATPTGLTTTLPASAGAVTSAAAIVVSGSFDGGMKRYERSGTVLQKKE